MFVRFAFYTLILFASWNFNLLALPDAVNWSRCEPRTGYIGTESHLVIYRLNRSDVHPLHPMYSESPDGPKTYRSQFGLPGIALAALRRAGGCSTAELASIAASTFAFLTALLLAVIFASAQRDLGPPTGDLACVLAAFAPVFVKFAPSLYWVTFLLLLPFAIVWCLGAWASTRRRRGLLLAAAGLAVFLKSLCGYEYITTVILAPVAASWFHQHRAGESLRRKLLAASALVAAGLCGLALGMAVHVAQIETVLNEDGVAAIRDRAAARTTGGTASEVSDSEQAGRTRLEFAADCFQEYFFQRALSTPATLGKRAGSVPLFAVIGFATIFAIAVLLLRRKVGRDAVALAGANLFALAAGLSWQVLATNHMCVHRHLNLIVFAVPFLPVAFVTFGFHFRRFGRWAGVLPLCMLPLLMAWNSHLAKENARSAGEEQLAAEEAVRDVLRHPEHPASSGVAGAIDRIGREGEAPPANLLEWGMLDLDTGEACHPDSRLFTGWASASWKSTPRPSARVVFVEGKTVVGGRVLWFRRPDLDALAGRPLHRVAFVAEVPTKGRLRVFTVSAADPTQIVELTSVHQSK